MGGSLMQLVFIGKQDIYLTGNPQITFFKVVYRRHTNFSMESIEQTFNGSADFGKKVSCTVSRNGDLISKVYLQVSLPALNTGYKYVNWVGHQLIKDVEVEIGGQRIDKHYGDWLHIWNELTQSSGLAEGYADMVGNTSDLTTADAKAKTLYIPLQFWFCRNPGLALPLIALQYHEVKINMEFNSLASCTANNAGAGDSGKSMTASLYVDYIYLDTDERRRFAQVSHEYLIEQVQRETGTMNDSQKLNFNHPVKELIWVVQQDERKTEQTTLTSFIEDATQDMSSSTNVGNDYFNYGIEYSQNAEVINGQSSNEAFGTLKLQLNGHDRFAKRNASYFRTCQPVQAGHKVPSKHVYCYSFALKPEEHQPSGTCNFSRIDNAKMIFETNSATLGGNSLTVYAVNYNVLRIMSGMGGLAYSN